MKPIIVGEAPSRTGDRWHERPLYGLPAVRMAEWAGLPVDYADPNTPSWDKFYLPLRVAFDVANLFPRWADVEAGWDGYLAAMRWADLFERHVAGRPAVLLGHRVGRAAGLTPGYFQWQELRADTPVVVIPHPSGLNRVYNDPDQQAMAGAVLRDAIGRAS